MTIANPEHLRRLPKVELHCHLEGSSRASTIRELAVKHGLELPVDDPEELFRFSNLNHFLEVLMFICRSLQTADDYRRITYEVLEDAAKAAVRYREMFFTPAFTMQFGVPMKTIWEGIKAGLLEARIDFDIQARMILDFEKPSGPAHAMAMAEFAATVDRDLLIGVGADSVERGIDHSVFGPAYRYAKRKGLRRTMHAGEDGPADNIRVALDDCRAERIDHGFRLFEDMQVAQRVVDERVPLTVCPTSNVRIANVVSDVANHPFDQMRRAGVLVSLGADDVGMLRFDVADEYEAVAAAFGYSLEDMEDISRSSIESSWASDEEKRALRKLFEREFEALRAEYRLPPVGSARRHNTSGGG